MKMMVVRLAMTLLVSALPCTAFPALARSGLSTRAPMPPTISGAAGPFDRVTVTIRTTQDGGAGGFSGVVTTPDGQHLALSGPDEPADLFLLEPRAVLFTPVDPTRTNGIVILYDSTQIGPRHGTYHRALVYRLTANAAVRLPRIEERLEDVPNAAAARTRLKRGR